MPDAQKVGKKERVPQTPDPVTGLDVSSSGASKLRSGKSSPLSWGLRVFVATAAILWVFHGQDWGKLSAAFRDLNPWWFVLSLAVFTIAQLVISLRWWLLLRAQSIHIHILSAVRLFFLGLFYNNVMPGAVGGDLPKAWYVTKHTDRKVAGILSVFVDRVIGLIGLILMAVVTYAIFVHGRIVRGDSIEQTGSTRGLSQYSDGLLWGCLAGLAVLAVLLIHPRSRGRLRRIGGKIWGRSLAMFGEIKVAAAVYCSKPWTLLLALLLTFVSQTIVIVAFWLLGRNLGIVAGLKYYLVVFPVMWVVSAVPVSIAGLGVFEAGMVLMFVWLVGDSAKNPATALALCQRFVWVLASLPGGLIHLVGAHLPRQDISVDDGEG